jgi:hypothetical protein
MTNSPRAWWSAIALAATLLLLATGCGGAKSHAQTGTNAAASTPQLTSIQELRGAFNSASREPTLIVLIAPT